MKKLFILDMNNLQVERNLLYDVSCKYVTETTQSSVISSANYRV